MKKFILCLILLSVFLFPKQIFGEVISGSGYAVSPFKVFTIQFSKAIDMQTINDETIYITNSSGILETIELTAKDSCNILVKNTKIYNHHDGTHVLHITTEVKSIDGEYLKEEVTKEFDII